VATNFERVGVADSDTATSDQAPMTAEQLVATASTSHDMGVSRRPARGHGYELRGMSYIPLSRMHEGRFGRMFRLQPFAPSDDQLRAIGQRMVEDAPADNAADNPRIPAGYTYLGQFIDHDLTFDTASSLERQNDPDALTNFRTPRFDLDCLYGRGPADDPYMYDRETGGEKLLIGSHDDEDDLPRNSQGIALIGDPRNDENIFVSQLHLTMCKFHNRVVDHVRDIPDLRRSSEDIFAAAQRIVRWHYQWMVMHDFLRRTVGEDMLGQVFIETDGKPPQTRRDFYTWAHDAYMPVEFSVGAYRFGHSQVRGAYKLNTFVPRLPTFRGGRIADQNPLSHFGGFRILPPFWTIEWSRFFDIDGPGADERQMSRRIDTKLAPPLTDLPIEIAPMPTSLIVRNLTRGARMLLPSGQDIAEAMRMDVLTDAELALPNGGPAPLWYYVLKEAEIQAAGEHLGQAGGRIVAEVFVGLLEKDPSSYLRNQPCWKPFLGKDGDFTMSDLITFADHGMQAITGPNNGAGDNGGSRT
jgi:hypothetical protein